MIQNDKQPWTYRMFASVDIAGSTHYKFRQSDLQKRWAFVFEDFFKEFPAELDAKYTFLTRSSDCPQGLNPTERLSLWKFVGDEILFSTKLQNHLHVPVHLVAFMRAVQEYGPKLSKMTLGLKATVWGAGFPCQNVEIQTAGKSVCDFLGPSVDLGFRLCRLADTRKLPISIDIAYFLAASATLNQDHKQKKWIQTHCQVKADQKANLKGVSPDPYPVFWLDLLEGKRRVSDGIWDPHRRSLEFDEILNYLEEDVFSNGVRRPFIEGDKHSTIGTVDPEVESWRQKLENQAQRELPPGSPEDSDNSTGRELVDYPDVQTFKQAVKPRTLHKNIRKLRRSRKA